MPTPSRNAIYDATIRRMTACALEEAENRFAVEHAQDTEQQLADYLNVERSALSNELSKMQRDGLLKVDKNRFELYGARSAPVGTYRA